MSLVLEDPQLPAGLDHDPGQRYFAMEGIGDDIPSLSESNLMRKNLGEYKPCPNLEQTLFLEGTFAFFKDYDNFGEPDYTTTTFLLLKTTSPDGSTSLEPIPLNKLEEYCVRNPNGVLEAYAFQEKLKGDDDYGEEEERKGIVADEEFRNWLVKSVLPLHCRKLGVLDDVENVGTRLEGVEIRDGEEGEEEWQDQSTFELGVFARMTVVLPLKEDFEGGEIRVKLLKQEKAFHLQDSQPFVSVTTWYTNSSITMKTGPVTTGKRVSLLYSLIYTPALTNTLRSSPLSFTTTNVDNGINTQNDHNATSLALSNITIPSTTTTLRVHDRLTSLLQHLQQTNTHLALPLKHQYPLPLSPFNLHDTDSAILRKLVNAAKSCDEPWSIHLASLIVTISRIYDEEEEEEEREVSGVDVVALEKVYSEFEEFPGTGMVWDLKDVLPEGVFTWDEDDGNVKCDMEDVVKRDGRVVEVRRVYKRTAILLWPLRKTCHMFHLTEPPPSFCPQSFTLPGGKQTFLRYASEQQPRTEAGRYAMFDLIRATAVDSDVHYMSRNRAVYTLRNHIPSMSPLSPADIEMIKTSFEKWVDTTTTRKEMEKVGVKGMTTDGMVKAILGIYRRLEGVYGITMVGCLKDLLKQGVDDHKLVKRCVDVVGWDRLEEFVGAAAIGNPDHRFFVSITKELTSTPDHPSGSDPIILTRIKQAFLSELLPRIKSFTKSFYPRGINTIYSHRKFDEDTLFHFLKIIIKSEVASSNVKDAAITALFEGIPVRHRTAKESGLVDLTTGRRSVIGSFLFANDTSNGKKTVTYTPTQRAIDEVFVPFVRAAQRTRIDTLYPTLFNTFLSNLLTLIEEAYDSSCDGVPPKITVDFPKVSCTNFTFDIIEDTKKGISAGRGGSSTPRKNTKGRKSIQPGSGASTPARYSIRVSTPGSTTAGDSGSFSVTGSFTLGRSLTPSFVGGNSRHGSRSAGGTPSFIAGDDYISRSTSVEPIRRPEFNTQTSTINPSNSMNTETTIEDDSYMNGNDAVECAICTAINTFLSSNEQLHIYLSPDDYYPNEISAYPSLEIHKAMMGYYSANLSSSSSISPPVGTNFTSIPSNYLIISSRYGEDGWSLHKSYQAEYEKVAFEREEWGKIKVDVLRKLGVYTNKREMICGSGSSGGVKMNIVGIDRDGGDVGGTISTGVPINHGDEGRMNGIESSATVNQQQNVNSMIMGGNETV